MLFFLEISQYSPISYYKWPENKKSEEKGHRSSEKQPFRHRRPLQTSVVDLGKQPTIPRSPQAERPSRGWRKRSNTSRRKFRRVIRGGTRRGEGMHEQKRPWGLKRKISMKQRQKPDVSEASH